MVNVDTTYMIVYHFIHDRVWDRLEEELHTPVWPINRVLSERFFIFFIVGIWTFSIFEIVPYSVNILLSLLYFFKKSRYKILKQLIY